MINNINSSMLIKVCKCPICGCLEKKIAYDEVFDWLFKSSDLEWKYYRCLKCETLYLVDMPKPEYIGLAYHNYYTHGDPGQKRSAYSDVLQKIMRNYLNSSRGANVKNKIIYFLYTMCFPLKALLDAKSRNLVKLTPGRMLDFGCGNGEFIKLAQEFGWDTKGYDMDSHAVQQANKADLHAVQGGINELASEDSSSYDLITLSHVIEHVYDAADLINECMRLLKPGGRLWIETPSSKSIGLKIYGKYWRGLEPPRHLKVFSHKSLSFILSEAGFKNTITTRHFLSGLYMCLASEKNKMLSRNYNVTKMLLMLSTLRGLFISGVVEVVQAIFVQRSEFITIETVK